jgi:CheY-like chemotaxis protein
MEAMGQLTGGVAHDFNNLLGVIMGNLQLLERPLRDDPKLHRKVRTATRAAMRGADLTQRLLAFSRHQRLEPKVVDLNGLIAGLDELVRRSLGENVDVATSFSGKLWPTLIDPGQLENAMVNLAINARDAMEGCGELAISTCNEKVDAEFASRFSGAVAGDYVVVSVADNGSGIPEEYLDRVFQPFFTTKEVGKGSGLGLSMVYGFVEQSGGFVAIDSEVGRGTDIRLYLPRAAEESVEPREETAMHRFMPGGDETVLVVDDEDDVRETVLALMDELGYRSLAAADGAAALAIVASDEPIDLLLTDVMMPGELDGPALAERTREVRPGMKILFTSGFADGKVLKRIDRITGSALIAKPYRNEELALRIRQTLDEDGANESQSQSTAGSR